MWFQSTFRDADRPTRLTMCRHLVAVLQFDKSLADIMVKQVKTKTTLKVCVSFRAEPLGSQTSSPPSLPLPSYL